MRLTWIAAGALVALAGCDVTELGEPSPRFSAPVRQVYQDAYQEIPFAQGAVYVVAPDSHDDRMRSYRLVPCQGGERICAGGLHGRAGHVTRGAEFFEVSGAYPNRTFYLSPGGDGYMVAHGVELPVAWDHDES